MAQAAASAEMGAAAESIREQLRQTAVSMRPGTTNLIHALENGSVEDRTEAAAALEELVTCSRETAQVGPATDPLRMELRAGVAFGPS